jgi:hypothetical protein
MTMRFATLLTGIGLLCACGTKTTATDTDDAAIAEDVSDVSIGVDATPTTDATTWQAGRKWTNTQGPAASGNLSAGIAQGYLDSPVGVSMAGYGGRNQGLFSTWSDVSKASRGFYGKMTIKAMALQVGTEKLIFVKSPLLTSESFLIDAITTQLATKYGDDLRGRMIFSATHSHHAPARFWPIPATFGGVGLDTFDAEVTARMAASFAEVIHNATLDLAPAEWAWAAFEDWDKQDKVYRDRRDENNPLWGKDPRLTLLAVRRPGGAVMASILNFPVHGTAFGEDNDLLTEDAPGAVENKLEEAWFAQNGAPLQAMFMQCAGGDASPGGDSLGHETPARLEKLGEDAAQLMLPKFTELKWKARMQLAVRMIRIDFSHDVMYAYPDLLHEFDQADGTTYEDGGWQCKAAGVADGESMAGKPKLCLDLKILLGAMDVVFPFGELNQSLLSAARLDDLAVITIPGEPTYSLVQYARQKIEGKTPGITSLMVVGYSQDYFLYLTAPMDWMLGGYESQMSLWGPAGGQYFADNSLALLNDILAGNTAPTFWESSPTLSKPVDFKPRAVEKSEDAGTVLTDLPDAASRTVSVDFAWGGGDANLGAPTVKLQRQVNGAWVDVVSPNGHKGLAYDNSRYEMFTMYQPIPEVASDILASRKHHWRVHWQVPADLPLGMYRLEAMGNALGMDGKAATVTANSKPLRVTEGPGTFTAKLSGTKLIVQLTVPPLPYANEQDQSWPATGWRLIDRDNKPQDPGLVRATLHAKVVTLSKTGEADLPFSESDKGCVVDLASLGLTAGALDVTLEIKGSDGTGQTIHVVP